MALKTFKAIATALAARSNETAGLEFDRLLQCLSVALQRENARAVLRRLSSSVLLDPRGPAACAPLSVELAAAGVSLILGM